MSIELEKSRRDQYEKLLEGWKIQEQIGKGSKGKTVVFRITNPKNLEFEEVGALKVVNIAEIDVDFDKIHDEIRHDYELDRKDRSQKAKKEVEAMYKLKDCPHVMRYLQHELCDWKVDSQFGCDLLIRMDYMETIWDLAIKQPLDEETVIQIGIDVCKALVACQQEKIIHRDIKPTNIFVDTMNHYRLGDFGIARIVEDSYNATTRVGTDPYMAPEQYRVDESGYDSRVDIYSLGLTLYVLCNKNNLPFKTHEVSFTTAVQERLRGDTPLPPLDEISSGLNGIIQKACEYRPENRYQNAQEFLDELEELKWQRTDYYKRKRNFQNQVQNIVKGPISTNAGEPSKSVETDKQVRSDVIEDTIQERFTAMVDQASREGDVVALCELGDCYMYGRGIPKDGKIALKCYSEAAEHYKFRPAELRLALCYMKGIGVCQNEAMADRWLRADESGGDRIDASIAFELANCYATGQGVKENAVKAVGWYRKAAEQGHAGAQCYLGKCYESGTGVKKDETEAVKWYRKAAEQGHEEAQFCLGKCYFYGTGVKRYGTEAVKWYRKAAEQGYSKAQYWLGECYYLGIGAEEDKTEAMKWYRKAAEQGYDEAQFCLGEHYYDGMYVEIDESEAAKWYRKAAEQGYAEAQNSLGVCYEYGHGVLLDYEEAVKWYRKAAEQGDDSAQCHLGECYEHGHGVQQNHGEAVKWYRKAAEQDCDEAIYCLGKCYESGTGVEKDETEAVEWYRKAAEQGYEEAQFCLGKCYESGTGVKKDETKAVRWYRKAAEQENTESQYNLGSCYLKGKGISKDEATAVQWFTKAAEEEHGLAQQSLGLCYMTGSGVQKDMGKAVEWLIKAEKQGIWVSADIDRCYTEMFKSVKPHTCTIVESTVHGTVTEVNCWKGQMVQAGKILAVLNTKDSENVEITAPVSGTIELVAAYTNRYIWPGTFLFAIAESTTKAPLSRSSQNAASTSQKQTEPASLLSQSPVQMRKASDESSRDSITKDFVIENGVLVKYLGQEKNIVLPSGITEIGDKAFKQATTLVSISLSDGIKKVGKEVFKGCTNLVSIFLPKSIVSISNGAFWESHSADSLTLCVEENSYSEQYAKKNTLLFMSMSKDRVLTKYHPIRIYGHQKKIVVPKPVLEIGEHAFSRCDDLACVIISEGVTAIGQEAFWGCRYLTSVIIPPSVKHIGAGAFSSCLALTVHAPQNSYAQEYAKRNRVSFSESQ